MGTHRLPMDSPHKVSVMQAFDIFFVIRMNKQLNIPPSFHWFEAPWRSLLIAETNKCKDSQTTNIFFLQYIRTSNMGILSS